MLGIKENEFKNVTGINRNLSELSIENLSIEEFMKLMKSLYLFEFDFRGGYSAELHMRRVCSEVKKGDYPFTVTKQIKNALKARRKEEWEADKSYGKRLRWERRFNRFFNSNVKFPSLEDVFPYWLLKICHKIRKRYALQVHILKHGNFKDFVYYDCRYDSKEQCKSDYYQSLYYGAVEKPESHRWIELENN